MRPREQSSGEAILARLRDRDRQFRVWLGELRYSDPVFAQASVLHADDWGEWQAATYLLTGCPEAWTALGQQVLATRSIAPVIGELDDGHGGWSSGERMLLVWVAHFWDVGRAAISFPYNLDDSYFRRWVTACYLYKRIPPDPGGGGR